MLIRSKLIEVKVFQVQKIIITITNIIDDTQSNRQT